MTLIVPHFQVHQPRRLRPYTFFDIGRDDVYLDDAMDRDLMRGIAQRSYAPMLAALRRAVDDTSGQFRFSLGMSSTVLRQLERWCPRTLVGFQELVATGAVEVVAETSHHSFAFLEDPEVFARQVAAHDRDIRALFDVVPTTFLGTELAVSSDLAQAVEALGYVGMMGEGAYRLLGWRSPHRVYEVAGCRQMPLLLRNARLSTDLSVRLGDPSWVHHPLAPDTFVDWLRATPAEDSVIPVFMDLEAFGERRAGGDGVVDFMATWPAALLADARFRFATPAEVFAEVVPVAALEVEGVVTWADQGRDLSPWLGTAMQRAAHDALYRRAPQARAVAESHPALWQAWQELTASDHLFHMSTRQDELGYAHRDVTPYPSPHDAFIRFMNVLDDLGRRIDAAVRSTAGGLATAT